MAWKELREIAWIALAAVIVYAVLAIVGYAAWGPETWIIATGRSEESVPFVTDSFVSDFWWLAMGLTVALGAVQPLTESIRGTWPFLLHRPATRRWVVAVKLLVGLSLYLVTGAAIILARAFWAATPGTHASPFLWSMTLPCWEVWFSATVVYFAAFLVGIRPVRWHGTRLLPLAVAVVVVLWVSDRAPVDIGWGTWAFWCVVAAGFLAALLPPGRWYSVRIGVIVAAVLAAILLPEAPAEAMGRSAIVFAADAAMIASILFVTRNRDYS
jgi:hypothetical protein